MARLGRYQRIHLIIYRIACFRFAIAFASSRWRGNSCRIALTTGCTACCRSLCSFYPASCWPESHSNNSRNAIYHHLFVRCTCADYTFRRSHLPPVRVRLASHSTDNGPQAMPIFPCEHWRLQRSFLWQPIRVRFCVFHFSAVRLVPYPWLLSVARPIVCLSI